MGHVRSSNFELYRIVVMLQIVAHHYVVNSGLNVLLYENSESCKTLFYYIFGMWGKIGINCFVLITGFFMCTSHITIRKFLKLVLQIEFYNFIISLIFLFCGYEGISYKSFFFNILPIKSVNQGFTSCFILFWLTIPFLNLLIKNMTEHQHKKLVLLCVFIYVCMRFIPHSAISMNYVSWFIVLYFIASFIRLYPNNIWKYTSLKFWGWMTILAVIMSMLSVLSMWSICSYMESECNLSKIYWMVSDCNAVFALFVGVTSFMFFKNIKIKTNIFINNVASTTFGVLLIHANSDEMRQWLWHDILNNVGWYESDFFYLHALISVFLVFSVCAIIDFLRIKLIEIPFFTILDKRFSVKPYWN